MKKILSIAFILLAAQYASAQYWYKGHLGLPIINTAAVSGMANGEHWINSDSTGKEQFKMGGVVYTLGTSTGYSLPTASTTVLGGVKIDGTTITISGGVISSTGGATPGGSNTQLQYNNSSAFGGISGATSDGTNLFVPTLYGSSSSGGTLTLSSTTNATKGKIIFGSASAYDQVNDRFGIGTTSPAYDLTISKSTAGLIGLVMQNTSAAGNAQSSFTMENDAGHYVALNVTSSGFSGTPNTGYFSGDIALQFLTTTSNPIKFIVNGSLATAPSLDILANKNVLVNSGTDRSTALLQVTQTAAQLALHYDASDYTTFTTSSAGNETITASGGGIGLGTTALTTSAVATGIAAYNSTYGTGLITSSGTSNDAITSASGTVATMAANRFQAPTFTATNTGVVYTNSYTVVIDNTPTAGTHVTQTNPYALGVLAGNSAFGGVVLPLTNVTYDLGTSALAWRDIYFSHTIGESAMGSSTSLGTNVTSCTASGSDEDFELDIVVAVGGASGTIANMSFGRTWIGRPHCTISNANNATIALTAGISANATSTSNLQITGTITTGTGVYNCHCGQ